MFGKKLRARFSPIDRDEVISKLNGKYRKIVEYRPIDQYVMIDEKTNFNGEFTLVIRGLDSYFYQVFVLYTDGSLKLVDFWYKYF